jgi:hypothetical protein
LLDLKLLLSGRFGNLGTDLAGRMEILKTGVDMGLDCIVDGYVK